MDVLSLLVAYFCKNSLYYYCLNLFELDDPDLDEDEENTEVGKLIIFLHTRASQTIPCHQSLSGNLISYVCPVTPPEAYISQIMYV